MTAQLAESVYREYSTPLHRYLMRRLADAEAALDLAQETYVRLLRIQHDELIRAPQAYVFRIASNLVYELRSRERRDAVNFDARLLDKSGERTSDPAVIEPGECIDIDRQLESVLAQLPPLYAAALVMKKRDGLSLQEIADELNLSTHTVKKYLTRAVTLCREWMSRTSMTLIIVVTISIDCSFEHRLKEAHSRPTANRISHEYSSMVKRIVATEAPHDRTRPRVNRSVCVLLPNQP